MQIFSTPIPPEQWSGDSLALALHDDELEAGTWAALDSAFGGAIAGLIADAGYTGAAGEVAAARLAPGSPAHQLVLVGLGRRSELHLDILRRAAALAVRQVKRGRSRTMALLLPPWKNDPEASAEAAAEGLELALHEGQWAVLEDYFKKPDGKDLPPILERVDLLGLGKQTAALDRAVHCVGGILLSRELVAAPANVVGPTEMAVWAARLSERHGLELTDLDREACTERRMGGFLAAASRSRAEPRFLHLIWRPPATPRRRVAVIGLGLTFDPGGQQRHPERRIEGMKNAMGGAGSVLGAAQAIAKIGSPDEIHFLLPCAEAGSGDGGLRPGDLVRFGDGQTVEVNGPDGEGRLMVAEALAFAAALEVDAMLDLATLSPACVMGLGEEIAGLWSTDDAFAASLLAAGERAGEALWRMPLAERYADALWAPFANHRCTGPAAGEAVVAALFLRRFTGARPWAHLDIRGPAWSRRVDGYYNAGATGFGVGTLVQWLRP